MQCSDESHFLVPRQDLDLKSFFPPLYPHMVEEERDLSKVSSIRALNGSRGLTSGPNPSLSPNTITLEIRTPI